MSEYKKGKLLKARSAGQTAKKQTIQPLDKKNITMSFVLGVPTRNKMCDLADVLKTKEIEKEGVIYDMMKPSDTQLLIGLAGRKAIKAYNDLQSAVVSVKELVDSNEIEALADIFMSDKKQVFELLEMATVVSYEDSEDESDEEESDEDEVEVEVDEDEE